MSNLKRKAMTMKSNIATYKLSKHQHIGNQINELKFKLNEFSPTEYNLYEFAEKLIELDLFDDFLSTLELVKIRMIQRISLKRNLKKTNHQTLTK